MAAPLTGSAREQYVARALASPTPLPDELEKLGFQGAAELATSRARLRGHITAIHSATVDSTPSPLAGGLASASPGVIPGGSRVARAPRLEAAGPNRHSAAEIRRTADEAIAQGMEQQTGILSTAAGSEARLSTAGQVLASVAPGFVPGLSPIAAKIHGEKVTAGDVGMEAAGVFPVLRGPRAILRAGKVLKAGEGASTAFKAGRASLKETGPITQAIRNAPKRTFRAGNLEVSIPAAGSRTGRTVEKLVDQVIRPRLSQARIPTPDGSGIGVMLSEEQRAAKELGITQANNTRVLRTTADLMLKYGRKLNDEQEYALRVIADGISPAMRVSHHLDVAAEAAQQIVDARRLADAAQAARARADQIRTPRAIREAEVAEAEAARAASAAEGAAQRHAFNMLHAEESGRASKYVKMVQDPERGLVPDLADNAPKALKRTLELFDEGGLQREELLKDIGRLVDERIQARIDASARVMRGARNVPETPGRLGEDTPRMRFQREHVARVEKAVARAEEITGRKRYTAADLKRIGSVSVDPTLEDRLQVQLDALNKEIARIRGRKPVLGEEVTSLIEERRALKRLEKFRSGLQKIAKDYAAEAEKLGIQRPTPSAPVGDGTMRPLTLAEAEATVKKFDTTRENLIESILKKQTGGAMVDPEEARLRSELNQERQGSPSNRESTPGYDPFDHTHQPGEGWRYKDGTNIYGEGKQAPLGPSRVPSQTEEWRRLAEKTLDDALEKGAGSPWVQEYRRLEEQAAVLRNEIGRFHERFAFGGTPTEADLAEHFGTVAVSHPSGAPVTSITQGVMGAEQIARRLEELDTMIEELGGKLPRADLGEVGKAAQRIRNQLKELRKNPTSIQDGNRVITASGDIVEPIGQSRLDHLNAVLSDARERLQQMEAAAARRVEPTGLVGEDPYSKLGDPAFPKQGRGYAPMWRGMPTARLAASRSGLVGLFSRADSLFGGGGRKVVGGGPDDAALRKAYTGSLLLSGFFTKDVVGPKVESMVKAIRMSAANSARKALLEIASDLPQSPFDVAIVVDPSKPVGWAEDAAAKAARTKLAAYWNMLDSAESAGTKLGKKDVERIDMQTVEDARSMMFPRTIGDKPVQQIAEGLLAAGGSVPNVRWIASSTLDETGLMYVPSAARLAKSGMAKRAQAGIATVGLSWTGLNDIQKGLVTFLNPAYAPVNLVGNGVMNAMQQGVYLPRNVMRAVQAHGELSWKARTVMDNAMGSTMTSALTLRTTPGQFLQGTLGHWISLAVDLMPRRLAFIHEAEKMGYSVGGRGGKRDLNDLLESARAGDKAALAEMDSIVRPAKDAIVDFDRMSPMEREVVARWIFFYPWLRGATRYSVRFMADHPLQAMAIALAYDHAQDAAAELLGDRPYYAKMQIPISTKSLGFSIPGTNIGVGLDQAVGEHTWKDAQGNPMIVNLRQMFTMTTPLELAEAGISFATGHGEAGANVVQMLTPVPYAGGVAAFGYDPFTKKKVTPGLATFFQQFGPMQSPAHDRIVQLNMSAEERAAYQKRALNPRSKGQEWARTFGSGLAPAPYNPEVGQMRALESKPKPERQTKTFIHDSEHAGLGTPPQEAIDDLEWKVKLEKKIHKGQSEIEHAKAVAEVFDERYGTGMSRIVEQLQTEGEAQKFYEALRSKMYPSYTAWNRQVEKVQDALMSVESTGNGG